MRSVFHARGVGCRRGRCLGLGAGMRRVGEQPGRSSRHDDGLDRCGVAVGQRGRTPRSEIAERIESFVDPTTNAPFRPLRAVLIETDGHTVLERYHRGTASDTSNVFSVTASVVGTLIGIALSDGSLRSVDQTLGELLPPLPLTWDPRKPLSRCGNCSR